MSLRINRETSTLAGRRSFSHRAVAAMVPITVFAFLSFGGAVAAAGASPAPLGLEAVGQAGSFFDLTIAPGSTVTLGVARTNPGASVVTAHSYASSVFTIANGGFGAANAGVPAAGATRWVRYPDEMFSLAPGATNMKSFTVTVPAGTAPGQYISSIVLQNNTALPGEGAVALDRVVRVAVAISIRVPGPLNPRFSYGAASIATSAGNSVVSVALHNDGNQNLKPAGTMTIRDSAGKTVSRSPVAMGTVYAGMDTTLALTLRGELLPDHYTVAVDLTDSTTGAAAVVTDAAFTVGSAPSPVTPDIVHIVAGIINAIVNAIVAPVADETVAPSVTEPAIGAEDSTSSPVPMPDATQLPALTPLMEEPAAAASMKFSCGVGDALDTCEANVKGLSMEPGSTVTVTAHSTPQTILTATVAADGTWSGHSQLPTNLEPGAHFIVLDYTANDGTAGTVAGALILDDSRTITNLSPPAAVAEFNNATAAALERAAKVNAPVFDVAAHPLTTAAVAVGGVSLLGVVSIGGGMPSGGTGGSGTGGSGGAGGGGKREKEEDGPDKEVKEVAKLLSAAGARELAKLDSQREMWGDRSKTWRAPGTATIDGWSRTLPAAVSRRSQILQRFIVDGAWSRAIFGSASVLLLALGPVLVVIEFLVSHRYGILPAWPVLIVLIVLGVLDSMVGLLSFLTIAVIAVASGALQSLADVRTLLGVFIVLATLPLISQAFRPIHRSVLSRKDWLERSFDYLLPPIFLGFAAASMLKALNGLSGLELVTPDNLIMVRWVVALALIARLILEDIAAIAYPERSRVVKPTALDSQSTIAKIVAAMVGLAIFLFVTGAYFGVSIVTIIAAAIFTLPKIARIWQDKLPNFPRLYSVIPRGFVEYVVDLVVVIVLAKLIIGHSPTPETVATGFIVLMLPGLFGGIARMFGRKGKGFSKSWLPLTATGASFVLGAGLVLGFIVLG